MLGNSFSSLDCLIFIASFSFEKELEEYYKFRDLWEINKVNQAKRFILSNPNYASIRSVFSDFDDTRNSIKQISETKDIDPFRYVTTIFKLNLFDEIRQLELIFAKYIRLHYRTKFLSINDFLKKTEPRLNRQLRDLDDVRFVINTLDTLKENFVLIDHTIDPLEVTTNFKNFEYHFFFFLFKLRKFIIYSNVILLIFHKKNNYLLKCFVVLMNVFLNVLKMLHMNLLIVNNHFSIDF